MSTLAIALAFLVAGSLAYCVLVTLAVLHWRNQAAAQASVPPISVLKPLAGAEPELAQNLRSFFSQDYPEYELLFAVQEASDAALPVVEQLRREFPDISSRVVVTGRSPWPSAKVFSLEQMLAYARHELIVMSDSDVRAAPGTLSTIAAEFADPRVGLVTCPYRAVAGKGFWSRLEAAFSNTEFFGGVMAARMIEGMHFALGPFLAVRRQAIARAGGVRIMREYHADDFVIGRAVSEAGYTVVLSRAVVEHHLVSEPFLRNAARRLRWVRSTRRSRPVGYIGQVFTNPLPPALLLCAVRPSWAPVLILVVFMRYAAAWAVCRLALNAPAPWLLLPLQDLVSFVFWLGGFFGSTIFWRGRRYRMKRDGRIVPA